MGCKECGKKKNVHSHEGCLCEVLRYIKRIQDIGVEEDCVECTTDCFMSPLGNLGAGTHKPINTRVFTLLTEDGTPFKAMFKNGTNTPGPEGTTCGGNCLSVFFRVQNVTKDCCATIQVLEPLYSNGEPVELFDECGNLNYRELCKVESFGPTDSCLTIDLKCFCGIQCIADCYIDYCAD